MKIGLVSGEYPPMQGGVGDFTRELARALAALGHQPHVITGSRQPSPEQPVPDQPFQVQRRVTGWGWGCWQALRAAARELGLEVVNVQYQAAAYQMQPAINFLPAVRRLLGLPPIVTTFHDLNAPYLFPKAGLLREWVVRELASRSDGVIVTNYEDEARLAACGVWRDTCQRIPIGSNVKPELPAGYERSAWRARWGAAPGDTLASYFGFLHPLKGGEALVRVAARLVDKGRPLRVLFIGGKTGSSDADTNAAYAARVESLAHELGLAERLAFTGYVTPQEVTAAFYASDVTVLPYLEGASLRHGTLMAALAHGRAIVTTRSRLPAPELQDGQNLLLVPPGDLDALEAGLLRVMDSPGLRARLERGAAELAQQFTWDRIAASTAALLGRVMGSEKLKV